MIANSPYGISLYESVRNSEGAIRDFKLKICNQKSAEITAFSMEDLYKYTVKELILIRGHSGYFEMCCKVVETGEPVYTDLYVPSRNKWIGMSLVKFDDGYLLNYIDITQSKTLEQQARKQTELLEGILNTTTAGLLVLDAITGVSGKILDFKIVLCNKAAENMFRIKPDDRQKSLLIFSPTAKANGLFDLYCEVIADGKSVTRTLRLKEEGLSGNYTISVSRMGESSIVQYISETPAG